MPLYQLPFHLRSIEQGVVAGFSLGAVFIVLTILADRKVWPFRLVVDLILAWRVGAIDETKRFALFKKVMFSLAGMFLMVAFLYGLVLTGVIANGNLPPVPEIEDFIRMQQERGR